MGFINPRTGNSLRLKGETLYDGDTNEPVASVIGSIPRFVKAEPNYADSFGWQWKQWVNTLSDSRNPYAGDAKYRLLLERTHFLEFELKDKRILECGMGGGDDTEALLRMPFSEVHSFDLSAGVERASEHLHDERLSIFQASIYEIPLPDRAFDFVFCHRVLQHTPDPEGALRAVCRKVKSGGILFVHIYHRSWHFLMQYKYKYRWFTRCLPLSMVYKFLDGYGAFFHSVNSKLRRSNKFIRLLAYNFIPFHYAGELRDCPTDAVVEIEKLITFDALTPKYDNPMKWKELRSILEDEGFLIKYAVNRPKSPLYCTCEKR